MVFNRRTMLQLGLGALTLSLTGCKNTKTTVVFVNNLGVALSINASASGNSFKKNNIQPGHSATQTYRSNDALGTVVNVTGTATPKGFPPVNLAGVGLQVKLGYKNTITVSVDTLSGTPTVKNVVT